MLESIADANMEGAAVIGIFIVTLIVILVVIARVLGLRLSSETEG